MVHRPITCVPGLYKIFDEILVNAAENKQRDPSMDSVKVDIDPETNCINVYNNGDGVPVEIHQEEGIYAPEMIFGHLLTSSNYDDNVKKTIGGRNGYGAKLTNIFSNEFIIQTADGKRQKKYKQDSQATNIILNPGIAFGTGEHPTTKLCLLLSKVERCIVLLEDSVSTLLSCLETVDADLVSRKGYFAWEAEEAIKCASFLRRIYEEQSGVQFPPRPTDSALIFTPPVTHLTSIPRHLQAGYGMPTLL